MVGIDYSDDAGVFKIDSDKALIQTLDFFTPIIDSPYDFGRIAAANSLSDVYAMGGKPLTAMNIVCFPVGELPDIVLKETIMGGLDKINESGAVLVGGHSVDDKEFKYGLSVTGLVHPDRVLVNNTAKTGDRLILTKPLGTGIIATAVKGKIASPKAVERLIEVVSELNKKACEIMVRFNPTACTDVTGFGLAGHLFEIARGSKKKISIYSESIPFIEQAREYADMGLIPAGAYNNRKFYEKNIFIDSSVDRFMCDIFFDPQTSGGLLVCLGPKEAGNCLKAMHDEGVEAAIAGEVTGDHPEGHISLLP